MRIPSYMAVIPLAVFFVLFLWLSAPPVYKKIVRYNFSGIDDDKLFPYRKIEPDGVTATRFALLPSALGSPSRECAADMDVYQSKANTLSLLVIQNGKIAWDWRPQSQSPDDPVLLYSVTKSIMSLLVAHAIDDGIIDGYNGPIADAFTGIDAIKLQGITVNDLMEMRSGLPYKEHAVNHPFSIHAKLTYTESIPAMVQSLRFPDAHTRIFAYKSIDYALLGLYLSHKLSGETVTEYFARKVSGPLGFEHEVRWSLDSDKSGMEKTWCCLTMTARDLAKIGQAIIDNNLGGGRAIETWRAGLISEAESPSGAPYSRGWWIARGAHPSVRAEGILGQFLYVSQQTNTVIVRQGRNRGRISWRRWVGAFDWISAQASRRKGCFAANRRASG